MSGSLTDENKPRQRQQRIAAFTAVTEPDGAAEVLQQGGFTGDFFTFL
jgi:hypothetical protein